VSDQLSPIHCVSSNLHQAARAVTRVYAKEMRSCGLTRSQFGILAYLTGLGTVTHRELADRLFMERTTLTRNLKPLEKQGLVKVKTSDSDARAREISLTELGGEQFQEARKLWQKAQRKLLNTFGEKNWRELESSLHTLRDLVS